MINWSVVLNTYSAMLFVFNCTGWSWMHIFIFGNSMDWVVVCCSFCDSYWLQDVFSMGGVCSRKRDQRDNEDNLPRGVSGRYFKSGSSKWLATSFSRPAIDVQLGRGKCPSLLYLCIRKILEVIFLFFLMLKSPCILVSSKKKKKVSLYLGLSLLHLFRTGHW